MRKMIVILFAGALLLLISNGAWAQEQEIPTEKINRYHVEFTNTVDKNAAAGMVGPPAPGQTNYTMAPDALGDGTPANTFRHGTENQVDAMANRWDAYLGKLVSNNVDLLISFAGDPNANSVWYETPVGARGVIWSKVQISNPVAGLDNLDGLEVYGPFADDANCYSWQGEALGGFSVFQRGAVGYVPKAAILAAIITLGWNGNASDSANIDLDALMVKDHGEIEYWDSPDTIIFSIRANSTWDGGEIVVLPNAGAAFFLEHGNIANHGDGTKKWNTAFNIQAAFGVTTEEVDAIEAWNEGQPGQVPALTNWGLLVLLVLLVLSGIIVIRHRRRGVARV